MNNESYNMIGLLKVGDPNWELLAHFMDDPNVFSLKNSAGVDSKIKTVERDGKTFKLQIFEFSGQEQFKTLRSKCKFRPADGIIIVYDVTAEESFNKVKNWLRETGRYANDSVPKLLVGDTKNLDEKNEEKVVKGSIGQELAYEFKIPFIETCAENQANLEEVLSNMAACIYDSNSTGDRMEGVAN